MKTLSTPFIVMFILFWTEACHAQWTNNPSNPQLVSNLACAQEKVAQVPDGSGGTFVFWKDSRVGCSSGSHFDVYGQHYDQDGNALWESSGREILDYVGTVNSFKVLRQPDGEMVIGSISFAGTALDSLRFRRIDDEGAPVWPQDLLVARAVGCSAPYYFLGFTGFNFIRDEVGYVVRFDPVYCGGSNGNRISRFNSIGSLTGPYQGEAEGNQFYIGATGIERTYDGSNDVYLYYTDGNGLGAHARCMRVNLMGDTIWGPVDVLAGTNGLNYTYQAMSDENGIAFCFQSNGNDGSEVNLYTRKLTTGGAWAWGPDPIPVCDAFGGQGTPHWTQDDNYYYYCWSDSRPGTSPGNADIYAQKVDKLTGATMWTDNGVETHSQQTYIPYPKCVVTPDGELIVINEAGNAVNEGFNAQKLNPDGTLLWAPTVVLCENTYSPFYEDYVLNISGTNVICAWARSNPGGGADGIYISRFEQLPALCPEDLNSDGVVNTSDLLLFMAEFGCISGCGNADLNNDGVVNTSDLLLFMAAFGNSCP